MNDESLCPQKASAFSVVLIGNFDGLHLGHRALFKKALEISKTKNIKSIVYTFTPHPKNKPRLMTDRQKEQQILALGIEQVVFEQFTPKFSSLSPENFISQILIRKLQAKYIFVGPNFAFGSQASGSIETLKNNQFFETHVIKPVWVENQICSSTKIRQAILEGDLALAKKLLGRDYSLSGKIIRGADRGAKLGFPTANLKVNQDIIPPSGVYATYSEKYGRGLTNIGTRPTFEENIIHIETYFLDLNQNLNLYNKEIEIFFKRKIREEKKFSSPEALVEQIKRDIMS